jgi:hypothetical protein
MTSEGKHLTEWLELMLGEIARKRDDATAARAEEERRGAEGRPEAVQPAR